MQVESVRRVMGVLAAGDFSDPTNERIIYASAAGLAVLGLVLLIGTIMWWRRGRAEHPVLAPLEVMSERAWVKAPDTDRRRRLDEVRPAGGGAAVDEPVRSEPVDLEALVRSAPPAFDDLRDPEPPPPVAEVAVEVADEADLVAPAADSVVDGTSVAARPLDEFADLIDEPAPILSEPSPAEMSDLEGLEAMASSPNDPLL